MLHKGTKLREHHFLVLKKKKDYKIKCWHLSCILFCVIKATLQSKAMETTVW